MLFEYCNKLQPFYSEIQFVQYVKHEEAIQSVILLLIFNHCSVLKITTQRMIYGWLFLFACRRLIQYSQPINYSECHFMSHKALCALISWKWLQIEDTSVCSGAVSNMFEPFHGFWQVSYLSPAPEFSASVLARLIIKPFRSEAFAQYARMLPLQSAVTRALFSYICKQKILIIVSFPVHCLREVIFQGVCYCQH